MTAHGPGGVRLHHRVDGPDGGPVLLFCNSLGTDLRMWDPQVAALAGRFRVARFDARGHGRSDAPAGAYRLEDLAADPLAVLDALGAARASVCGISLGGMVAMRLASDHPDRVARLLLVSTATRIGTPEGWEERVRLVRTAGMSAVADVVIPRFFTEGFRRREPGIVAEIEGMVRSTAPDGYVGSCRALGEADLFDVAPTISAPALVVAGRHDAVTPPEDVEGLTKRLPRAELAVLDESSHLCNLEVPDRFNELVTEFLARSEDV